MKAYLTPSNAYLIYSGASNHMVASGESFTTFTLSGGPNTHMVDDSQIPYFEIGSVKIQHNEFNTLLYVPSPATKQVIQYEEEVESSTQLIRIEESLLGVTPSLTALEVYEIYDISSSHISNPE